jgi:hypothetical protein
MNKEQALRILKILSIFEALGLMSDKCIPDYLFDETSEMKLYLENIVLGETK